MHATPLLIASLAASIAGPCLGQNAQYPPWPPPATQSSYDPYGPPPQPPPPPPSQPYDAPYDDPSQAAPYAAQPGAPEPPPQNYPAPYDDQAPAAPYAAQPGEPPPQAYYAPYDEPSRGAPNAAQLGAPPSPQLVTPSQEGSKTITTAASAPLHQLNLVNQRIPPVLLAALADPYVYPSPLTCEALASAIDELTVALGPDYDYLPAEPQRKKVTESGGMGLQLANGAAGSILPYGGLIGMLTGANKRDAKIMRALAAGGARRAYLKGLGEAGQCPAPATPRHLAEAAAPIYDGPRRPQYPIR
jgi:hypothetical protein